MSDATSFTKNRERLDQGKVFHKFMAKLLAQPEVKLLLSDEHFSVDGAHVTQNDALTKTGRRRTSAIDRRTTRHVSYRISQSCRAMVECIFGWGKQHGTMRKTKQRGITRIGADFMLNLIAYNLVRIPKLIALRAWTPSDQPLQPSKSLTSLGRPSQRPR